MDTEIFRAVLQRWNVALQSIVVSDGVSDLVMLRSALLWVQFHVPSGLPFG